MGTTLIRKLKGLRFINAALLLLAGSLIVSGACNFGPEAPTVDQATLWMDTVRRGDLAIERRGVGQLVKTESGELKCSRRPTEST